MKITKKIKTSLSMAMIALMFTLLPISAFAGVTSDAADCQEISESLAETAALYSAPTNEKETGEVIGDVDTQSPETTETEIPTKDGESNVFTLLFDGIISCSNDILTVVNFIISLIVAICYKRGLVPKLEKTGNSIQKSLTALNEGAARQENEFKENERENGKKLEILEKSVHDIQDKLSETAEALKKSEQSKNNNKTDAIMLAQIDMLYNIFISSALPEYQKESVGNQINKMKESLSKNEQ